MKTPRIVNAVGHIDDDLVTNAVVSKKKAAKSTWLKWGSIAACVCLLLVGMFAIMNGTDHGMPGEVIVDREPVVVTIKEWKDEGFVCTVDDPDIHAFITEGYQVLVRFGDSTKVSGTEFKYDSENPNASECGLSVGTQVELYFDAVDYKDNGMAHALGATEIIPK